MSLASEAKELPIETIKRGVRELCMSVKADIKEGRTALSLNSDEKEFINFLLTAENVGSQLVALHVLDSAAIKTSARSPVVVPDYLVVAAHNELPRLKVARNLNPAEIEFFDYLFSSGNQTPLELLGYCINASEERLPLPSRLCERLSGNSRPGSGSHDSVNRNDDDVASSAAAATSADENPAQPPMQSRKSWILYDGCGLFSGFAQRSKHPSAPEPKSSPAQHVDSANSSANAAAASGTRVQLHKRV